MKLLKILSAVGASLILIGPFAPAQAANTDVVLNLEGNPTCSSLGPNSDVLEYRDNSPDIGDNSAVLPLKDGGTQTVTYKVGINDTGKAEVEIWKITDVVGLNAVPNPINYTILKAQGGSGARVFHFGGNGAFTDTEEIATGSKLAALSFCYGLTGGVAETAPVPSCEDLIIATETLDGTGIVCETVDENDPVPEPRLLINMSLDETNFGFNDGFHACTCNVPDASTTSGYTGLPECNPALPAFDVSEGASQEGFPPEARSCMEYDPGDAGTDDIVPAGVNAQVPTSVMGVENPDSYICYTIDGVRTCYGHY